MSEGQTCNGHEFCTGLTPSMSRAVYRVGSMLLLAFANAERAVELDADYLFSCTLL